MPRIKSTPVRGGTNRFKVMRFAAKQRRRNAARAIQRAFRNSRTYRRNVAHMSFNRKFGFRNPYL